MSERPRNDWAYFLMRRIKPRFIKNYRMGLAPSKMVLLLTTIGRKSGLARITPLQYEEIDGSFYLASARGERADWLRNIQARPQVKIEVGKRILQGQARVIKDTTVIADFLAMRLERHPFFIGILLRLEGLPLHIQRSHLEKLALHKSLVVVTPLPENPDGAKAESDFAAE